MEKISKSFPGVQALDEVSIELFGGEVLGLVGENGAGKSTLMNVLNGIVQPDQGQIYVEEKEKEFSSLIEAQDAGIAYIQQELNLIDELSVQENLFLGKEPLTPLGTIKFRTLYKRSQEVLTSLGLKIPPREKTGNLSLAKKQMVEIAKALLFEAKIIVMDEPTSSLTDEEIKVLYQLICRMRDEGKGIIYISHRMEEIFSFTDRISVLRNGACVGTKLTREVDHDGLVRMMAGRDVEERFFKEETTTGPVLLELESLCGQGKVRDVSLQLREGEILGVGGLMGSGRTELLETIFGIFTPRRGQITLNGKTFKPSSPYRAIDRGIAYIPEDRESKGLFLDFSLLANLSLTRVEKDKRLYNEANHRRGIEKISDMLGIVAPSLDSRVENLSGGNRQKVILARWIYAGMKVLLVNEPTRGIDVGTKTEIYKLLYDLNKQGVGIIVVSSELTELLMISDRIITLYEGQLSGEFSREEANQEVVLQAMTGKKEMLSGTG